MQRAQGGRSQGAVQQRAGQSRSTAHCAHIAARLPIARAPPLFNSASGMQLQSVYSDPAKLLEPSGAARAIWGDLARPQRPLTIQGVF